MKIATTNIIFTTVGRKFCSFGGLCDYQGDGCVFKGYCKFQV